jgi:hypothetical protein
VDPYSQHFEIALDRPYPDSFTHRWRTPSLSTRSHLSSDFEEIVRTHCHMHVND